MVACARLAASTIDVFTVSRLLSASASQSNSSSSRCRPSACILSLLSALLSLARNFAADFLNVGPCFWHCKEKMGWKAIFGGVAAASAPAPRALGAARGAGPRDHRIAPEGHFSLAFPLRAANINRVFQLRFSPHEGGQSERWDGIR